MSEDGPPLSAAEYSRMEIRDPAIKSRQPHKNEMSPRMIRCPNLAGMLPFLAVLSLLLGLGAGCSSSKVEVRGQSTATSVALSGKNYKMIKAGAKGQSYGFGLLGILPFGSPNHAAARRSLYSSVHEPLTGRAAALAHEMEDRSTL